jgi:1-acyl-sn-glycerol-3-phosphate acyltransferase
VPGAVDDRFILRSITDEIMYALMDLSGQEYVDMYATDAKKILAAEKAAERAEQRAEAKKTAAAERRAAIEEQQRLEADEEARRQ